MQTQANAYLLSFGDKTMYIFQTLQRMWTSLYGPSIPTLKILFSKKREVNLHVSLDGSPLCRLRFGPLTSPAQGFEMTWQSLYF